jgi:hypothetical protein
LIVIEATSSANKITSSKNNYSFNPEDFNAFNCTDSPFALDGFELIYKSVISSQYGEVSKSCISNFIQLFKCSNKIPNQREQFESKMQEYLQKGLQQLKDKNII